MFDLFFSQNVMFKLTFSAECFETIKDFVSKGLSFYHSFLYYETSISYGINIVFTLESWFEMKLA